MKQNSSEEAKHAKVDLVVWGDYACFTRPEFKSERESYEVITPAAARGILEAIYWKPQMRYRILEIHVHRRGQRFSMLRNELASRQTTKASGGEHRILIDHDRQQRTSLILKDVAYRIKAWIDLRADEPEEKIGKHIDCVRRRAEAGAYHHKPCLGCREFPANFAPFGDPEIPNGIQVRDNELFDHFGTMLFDTAYIQKGSHHQHKDEEMTFYHHRNRGRYKMAGRAERIFFKAEMNEGIIAIPQEKYDEIAKLEGKRWDSTRH